MLRIIGFLFIALTIYLFVHNKSPVVTGLTTTRIDEILSAPRAYEGRAVTVRGIVTGGIGVMGVGGYHLRDVDRAEDIFVVSGTGVPASGTTVTITGVFRQVFTVGAYELSAIIVKP